MSETKFMEGAAMTTSQITTLFIEVGGVLLTNCWDRNARRRAAETFDLDFEEMNERHYQNFDTYEVGKLSLDEYLRRVVFYERRCCSLEEFRSFIFAQSNPFPEMIDLVCRLKTRHGLKIAAVNNEGRELSEYRIRTFNLGSFVDFFISSCFVHLRKPDSDMFQVALDAAQVKPQQVAYIGDSDIFVYVASALGITGIVHKGYKNTKEELAQLGLSL
jgi:putative hydrolase of the HAD superfamily